MQKINSILANYDADLRFKNTLPMHSARSSVIYDCDCYL